jgi:hypothetical protein
VAQRPRDSLRAQKARETARALAQTGAKRNPGLSKEQAEARFRDLVMDPDPNAMLIAEDLVIENGLSLADISEQMFLDEHGSGETSVTLPHAGMFILDPQDIRVVVWRVYALGGVNLVPVRHETEITVAAPGVSSPEHGSTGSFSWAHKTYYPDPNVARREAAADAWVVAKALKRKPDATAQDLVDAMFLPDGTPSEVFGGKRAMRQWGQFDVPSKEAMEKIRQHLAAQPKKRAKPGYRMVPKKNPGELDEVVRQYDLLIHKGVARVLWAYAYGAWAQQDITERDLDAVDVLFDHLSAARQRRIESAPEIDDFATWIRTMPVQVEAWLEVPTKVVPSAAFLAANSLGDAVSKVEGVSNLVDLFALVSEIETGEPFEYVTPPEPPMRRDRIMAVDSANGIYIPQRFAERFGEQLIGVPEDTVEILLAGPDPDEDLMRKEFGDNYTNEWYDEAWDDVLRGGKVTSNYGHYTVDVADWSGDVWLTPEGMEWSDEEEGYVWPEPELPLAEQFGRALAHMALRDGMSWFDDHPQERGGMRWEPAIPQIAVAFDGDEMTWKVGDAEKKASTEHRIAITFERHIPPETNEPDDVEWGEERGWEDEEGVLIEPDEDGDVVEETVRYLNSQGPLEASSSSFSPHVWYTQVDGHEDYQTGERTTLSFHLRGYTEDEQRRVFDEITEQG